MAKAYLNIRTAKDWLALIAKGRDAVSACDSAAIRRGMDALDQLAAEVSEAARIETDDHQPQESACPPYSIETRRRESA